MRNPININLSSEGQIKILDSFSELFDLLPAEKVENSTSNFLYNNNIVIYLFSY